MWVCGCVCECCIFSVHFLAPTATLPQQYTTFFHSLTLSLSLSLTLISCCFAWDQTYHPPKFCVLFFLHALFLFHIFFIIFLCHTNFFPTLNFVVGYFFSNVVCLCICATHPVPYSAISESFFFFFLALYIFLYIFLRKPLKDDGTYIRNNEKKTKRRSWESEWERVKERNKEILRGNEDVCAQKKKKNQISAFRGPHIWSRDFYTNHIDNRVFVINVSIMPAPNPPKLSNLI